MTYDGLHPNDAGEKHIAARWLAAIMQKVGTVATHHDCPTTKSKRASIHCGVYWNRTTSRAHCSYSGCGRATSSQCRNGMPCSCRLLHHRFFPHSMGAVPPIHFQGNVKNRHSCFGSLLYSTPCECLLLEWYIFAAQTCCEAAKETAWLLQSLIFLTLNLQRSELFFFFGLMRILIFLFQCQSAQSY